MLCYAMLCYAMLCYAVRTERTKKEEKKKQQQLLLTVTTNDGIGHGIAKSYNAMIWECFQNLQIKRTIIILYEVFQSFSSRITESNV
jgi:hypothetical protein